MSTWGLFAFVATVACCKQATFPLEEADAALALLKLDMLAMLETEEIALLLATLEESTELLLTDDACEEAELLATLEGGDELLLDEPPHAYTRLIGLAVLFAGLGSVACALTTGCNNFD